MAPEKKAQSELEKVCSVKHSSMAKFAEQFRIHATQSGYLHTELIARINKQRSKEMQQVLVSIQCTTPQAIPTTWPEYLEYLLTIEMQFRVERPHTSKKDDSANVNAVYPCCKEEKKPLNDEQKKWAAAGKCFKCGNHDRIAGKPCRKPKYNGWFDVPQEWLDLGRKNTEKRRKKEQERQKKDGNIRVVASQSGDSSESAAPTDEARLATLRTKIAGLERSLGLSAVARIEEVVNSPDFSLATL